jgi:hypothetical protein
MKMCCLNILLRLVVIGMFQFIVVNLTRMSHTFRQG